MLYVTYNMKCKHSNNILTNEETWVDDEKSVKVAFLVDTCYGDYDLYLDNYENFRWRSRI